MKFFILSSLTLLKTVKHASLNNSPWARDEPSYKQLHPISITQKKKLINEVTNVFNDQ